MRGKWMGVRTHRGARYAATRAASGAKNSPERTKDLIREIESRHRGARELLPLDTGANSNKKGPLRSFRGLSFSRATQTRLAGQAPSPADGDLRALPPGRAC
jgi:hypothetical protein